MAVRNVAAKNCHVAMVSTKRSTQSGHNFHFLTSKRLDMKLSLPSALGVAAVLVITAPFSSDAYVFGPQPTTRRSNVKLSTGIFGPGISYYVQKPAPIRSAAMAAVPAQQQKNGFQRMLDFYCGMVWIARPDLFLYDRLARMAWDNVSKTLKQLEQDRLPENVLNKALKEMQNDLAKIQNAYADVTDTQKRMYAQKLQAEAAADEWYRRAEFALSRGYEQTSKDALFRRQELLEGAEKLQVDIDAQNETREKLYTAFQNLEEAFREKVAKRDDLMERAKTAKQMTKINEMLNEFNSNRLSEDVFESFEKKVETLEAAAEASSPFSWLGGTSNPISEDDRLEMEFAKLEKSAAMEEDLKMLQKERRASRSSSSSSSRAQEEWLDQLLGSRRY
jgi:phage shock protein A